MTRIAPHADAPSGKTDRPVPRPARQPAAGKRVALLCPFPARSPRRLRGVADRRSDRRAGRGRALQLSRPAGRSGARDARRVVLRTPPERIAVDGVRRADPAPTDDRGSRCAGAPGDQPEPGQHDPLAEPPLRAQAEPVVLPERLRRPHRAADHADRLLAARLGRAGRGCALARDRLRGQFAGAVRRGRLAADNSVAHLDRRVHRRAGVVHAPGQATLRGGHRRALAPDGPHRRRLYQHHHAQAVRPLAA